MCPTDLNFENKTSEELNEVFFYLDGFPKEDYLPLNLFTYIMNIYVICIVYMNFPKSFKCKS